MWPWLMKIWFQQNKSTLLMAFVISCFELSRPAFRAFCSPYINPYNVDKWYDLKKGDRWLQSAKIGGEHFNDQQLNKQPAGNPSASGAQRHRSKIPLLRKMSGSQCILSSQTAQVPTSPLCWFARHRKVGEKLDGFFKSLPPLVSCLKAPLFSLGHACK